LKLKNLKPETHSNDSDLKQQIKLYLQYLKDLKTVCIKLEIPFEKSDRILYMADKDINKKKPLDNYSNKKAKNEI
jgi:hypothetical protein